MGRRPCPFWWAASTPAANEGEVKEAMRRSETGIVMTDLGTREENRCSSDILGAILQREHP